MSDTAIVASYNPLSPVFPQSGETLVAQGSSVQVFILQGGRVILCITIVLSQIDFNHISQCYVPNVLFFLHALVLFFLFSTRFSNIKTDV